MRDHCTPPADKYPLLYHAMHRQARIDNMVARTIRLAYALAIFAAGLIIGGAL